MRLQQSTLCQPPSHPPICHMLPQFLTRILFFVHSGGARQCDAYYFSPEGKQFRSMNKVGEHLGFEEIAKARRFAFGNVFPWQSPIVDVS